VAAGYTHALFFGVDYYTELLDQPALAIPASTSANINVFAPVYGRVIAPPAGLALARSLTRQDLKSVSASAQDQVDMDDWSVIAGLRYTDQQSLFGSEGVLPITEANWSPKLGLLYRLSGSSGVYANLATGLSPNQVASSSNRSLPSRKATQAEAGWKATWLGKQLTSDVAVYHLKQTNMISADQSTPLNNFDFTVGGSARSQGWEASLTGAVTQHLDLAATYAYTDAGHLQNSLYGGKRVPNVARVGIDAHSEAATLSASKRSQIKRSGPFFGYGGG
jgi:iron complex outermembrane recepter protein